MAEVSVFDAYQVQRALRGHLADGDAMEMLARDDATGAYWVLTHHELILVKDQEVGDRLSRHGLAGSIEVTDVAVTVRVRGGEPRTALLGTFRKPNRLTRALAEIIGEVPR
jgi:hypothetical protein